MDTRKVLQEIPILPPGTEEQSFVVIAEEVTSDFCNKMSSFPTRAHAKYISTDESKENITPAEFDGNNKYNFGKSDVDKPADLMDCPNLGDGESSGSGSDISLQQKDDITLGKTAGSGSIVTPRKDADGSDWRIGESNTPIDFSNVTVDAFGISSESFTNCVGKSPRSLHKHRRRSTIGVRGSPEMNFLIRQIALQKSKKTSPEPLSNPFISPRNSILKEKMSSFRNAFQAVEENEGKLQFPGFSEEEEETQCSTLGGKAYGNTCDKVEPPVKRKRVCDTSLPEIPLISMQPQKATRETEQVPLLERISESGPSASRLFTAVSNSVNVLNEEIPPVPSSTRGQKRKVMFADLSPAESRKTLCSNQTRSSDSHTSSNPVLRPVLKKISWKDSRDEIGYPTVCFAVPELSENENNTLFKKTVNDSVKKKKSVTFGKALSPELFDKSLPANTPLRKGSTPYRQQISDTATPTALEAVRQSPCQPLSQPDFDCQDEEDTFKPLSLSFDTESPSQDSTIGSPGNNDQLWPIDELEDVTQENNHREEDETLLISYDFLENTTTAAPAMDTDIADETFIECEPDTVPTKSRVTRSSNKSKACSSEDSPICEDSQTADNSKVQVRAAAKPSSKRGRKPGSIKRVMVKVPRVKGKKGRGRPKKSSQKPFYGERETVSKKPLLSPILELPECYPTPPASTPVSSGGSLNKGLVKRIAKRKGIRRVNRNVEKSKVHPEVGELVSDPTILKIEDLGCPGQEDLEVKHTESLTDSQGHTELADLVVQVGAISTNAECPLSSADKQLKPDEYCLPEPGDSVPEDKSTIKTVSALKPQKSKRRSTTRRRVSQTPTEVQHAANSEAATDLLETLINAEHNTLEKLTEDPKPEKDLVVEDSAPSPKLPVITDVATGKKGRRLSRNYHKPAIFYSSTEPNAYTQDPCILPQPDENSTTFTSEPYLPFDNILQSAGTEKKVRRSLRLRRDSGASGLFWVSETTSSEGTSRRKSLSSAVKPLGNSNLILESVTCSPNKEQLSVQQIPGAAKRKSLSSAMQSLENSKFILESLTYSPNKEQLSVQQVPGAAKKTRRRTLCSSTLQQMTSLGDTKRRRSNVSYKDSYVPSAEPQTCPNNIMLDT